MTTNICTKTKPNLHLEKEKLHQKTAFCTEKPKFCTCFEAKLASLAPPSCPGIVIFSSDHEVIFGAAANLALRLFLASFDALVY